MPNLYAIIFSFCMVSSAHAAGEVLKHPLSYSLREYGFVLVVAIGGGIARWILDVRSGDQKVYNIAALIGEMVVSAFAGLVAFWLCEWRELHPLVVPAVTGMAGYMGGGGLKWMERNAKRSAEKRLRAMGIIDETMPANLQEKSS